MHWNIPFNRDGSLCPWDVWCLLCTYFSACLSVCARPYIILYMAQTYKYVRHVCCAWNIFSSWYASTTLFSFPLYCACTSISTQDGQKLKALESCYQFKSQPVFFRFVSRPFHTATTRDCTFRAKKKIKKYEETKYQKNMTTK